MIILLLLKKLRVINIHDCKKILVLPDSHGQNVVEKPLAKLTFMMHSNQMSVKQNKNFCD